MWGLQSPCPLPFSLMHLWYCRGTWYHHSHTMAQVGKAAVQAAERQTADKLPWQGGGGANSVALLRSSNLSGPCDLAPGQRLRTTWNGPLTPPPLNSTAAAAGHPHLVVSHVAAASLRQGRRRRGSFRPSRGASQRRGSTPAARHRSPGAAFGRAFCCWCRRGLAWLEVGKRASCGAVRSVTSLSAWPSPPPPPPLPLSVVVTAPASGAARAEPGGMAAVSASQLCPTAG